MENVEGGKWTAANTVSCAIGVIGFGIAFASLVTATGGAGLFLAAAGYSLAPAGAALSCLPS